MSLLPERPASQVALVAVVAAIAFGTTLWIGGLLRDDEPAPAPAKAAAPVTLRVALPDAEALPSLAPAPRRQPRHPWTRARRSPRRRPRPPAPVRRGSRRPAPPPPPAASNDDEEIGHSVTP